MDSSVDVVEDFQRYVIILILLVSGRHSNGQFCLSIHEGNFDEGSVVGVVISLVEVDSSLNSDNGSGNG